MSLSLRYNFVTELTSLIVVEEGARNLTLGGDSAGAGDDGDFESDSFRTKAAIPYGYYGAPVDTEAGEDLDLDLAYYDGPGAGGQEDARYEIESESQSAPQLQLGHLMVLFCNLLCLSPMSA